MKFSDEEILIDFCEATFIEPEKRSVRFEWGSAPKARRYSDDSDYQQLKRDLNSQTQRRWARKPENAIKKSAWGRKRYEKRVLEATEMMPRKNKRTKTDIILARKKSDDFQKERALKQLKEWLEQDEYQDFIAQKAIDFDGGLTIRITKRLRGV